MRVVSDCGPPIVPQSFGGGLKRHTCAVPGIQTLVCTQVCKPEQDINSVKALCVSFGVDVRKDLSLKSDPRPLDARPSSLPTSLNPYYGLDREGHRSPRGASPIRTLPSPRVAHQNRTLPSTGILKTDVLSISSGSELHSAPDSFVRRVSPTRDYGTLDTLSARPFPTSNLTPSILSVPTRSDDLSQRDVSQREVSLRDVKAPSSVSKQLCAKHTRSPVVLVLLSSFKVPCLCFQSMYLFPSLSHTVAFFLFLLTLTRSLTLLGCGPLCHEQYWCIGTVICTRSVKITMHLRPHTWENKKSWQQNGRTKKKVQATGAQIQMLTLWMLELQQFPPTQAPATHQTTPKICRTRIETSQVRRQRVPQLE